MTENRLSPYFLKHIKLVSFGAFYNKVVGPFSPGLNVVYAKNEGGKTTLNAFVSGVLFGWEDGRGASNTYKPSNAEREGFLFFENEKTKEEIELYRSRNILGLQGETEFIDDIDKETFKAIFGLSSDELRDLRNTSDITSKLLTAGSGTVASPASALGETQKRIAEYTSRAAEFDFSLVQLEQKQTALREDMNLAAEEAERFKVHDRELADLAPKREEMQKKIQLLNREIEDLSAYQAIREKLYDLQTKTLEDKQALQLEEGKLLAQMKQFKAAQQSEPITLAANKEAAIREKIDSFTEEVNRAEASLSLAKQDFVDSHAAFKVLDEMPQPDKEPEEDRKRRTKLVGTIVPSVLFAVAGLALLIFGILESLMAFTISGIILIVGALVFLGVMLFLGSRPEEPEDDGEKDREAALKIMLQDQKKMELREAEKQSLNKTIRVYLEQAGLEQAYGSPKRARELLDEAKDFRAKESKLAQEIMAVSAQIKKADENLEDIKTQKAEALEVLEFTKEPTQGEISNTVNEKTQERTELLEASKNVNHRYGELQQELSQAKGQKSFDALKLEHQQIRTQQKESAQDYARLLLTKRILETAITAWESKSQPEVYKQASRILSQMTLGKWEKVSASPEGKPQVKDGTKTTRDPLHLSLGTCQQLYLSLRIALLMTAENVGRAIPIMADDILVHFDAERSRGAIVALAELATQRQVILFTCHEEIVRLMQSCHPQINLVEL